MTHRIRANDLAHLTELAEEALYMQATEFSNPPTDEELALMRRIWKIVGKEMPPYFCRFVKGK